MTFRLWLDPVDTVMFRDGRPFNQDDAGRAAAASLFPPPPESIYGAARVGLARAMGWTGSGDWGDIANIAAALGSWKAKGAYKCAGPYFAADGRDLLPAPAHLYAGVDSQSGRVIRIAAARPGAEMHTDIGVQQFLELPATVADERAEPLAGRWLPAEWVLNLLDGEEIQPADLRRPGCCNECDNKCDSQSVHLDCLGWRQKDLAATEPRVGLERNRETRIAEDGNLYVSARRRLGRKVRLFAGIDGVDPNAIATEGLAIPVGGESRFAFLAAETRPAPAGKDSGRLIYCATPFMPKPGEAGVPLAALLPPFVAAAVPGIDILAGFQRGGAKSTGSFIAARPVVPAGSVFFLEDLTETSEWTGKCCRTHMGYGRLMAGEW